MFTSKDQKQTYDTPQAQACGLAIKSTKLELNNPKARPQLAPAYGEYLRSDAAIAEDWNSDDVGACYLPRIGPRLERSALLRVEVPFSFGG
jgi:hypothetical protein